MENNYINNSLAYLLQISRRKLFGILAGSSLVILLFIWIKKNKYKQNNNNNKHDSEQLQNKIANQEKKQEVNLISNQAFDQNQYSEKNFLSLIQVQNLIENQTQNQNEQYMQQNLQEIKIQNFDQNQANFFNFQVKRSLIKIQSEQLELIPIKSQKQLEEQYQSLLFGSISLNQSNQSQLVTSITFKQSQILLTNNHNQLILFNLKKLKKQKQNYERFYTNLQTGNTGTAVSIGKKHYYVALDFDKTIAIYDFNGVYFQLFKKFQNDILSSDSKALYIPLHQNYIATVGSGLDTVIQVWNLEGQKLQSLNTYQIDHYSIGLGAHQILIRGWTSQVKQFVFYQDQQGYFKNLQKSKHLPHQQSPLCSNIDNLGKYTVTVNKNKTINLWDMKSQLKYLQRTLSIEDMKVSSISNCYLHTIKYENGSAKTIIILIDKTNKIYICDTFFRVIKELQGVESKQVSITEFSKSLLLFTMNSKGKVYIWNLKKLIDCIEENNQRQIKNYRF